MDAGSNESNFEKLKPRKRQKSACHGGRKSSGQSGI
jgi:hypothetical protein